MATSQTKKQYTVKDNAKQITTICYNNTHPHIQKQISHPYHYCNLHEQDKKSVQHNYDCNNVIDVDDFYYIKAYHQAVSTTATHKSGTLNQSINFIYNKSTTKTTTPAAAVTRILSHVLHSLSHTNSRSFVTILLLVYLLLVQYVMAAPQSCILCDKNDLQAKDPQTNFEEFLFEHQVTRQDAINALRQLNESFYEGTASGSSCNAVRCTEKVMKYCLGPQFINDHCWCEVGHSTEGLPFVPHICYVGEKIYKTSVGSCFFYEEVKDCCCSSLLAKEWRHISAGSPVYNKALFRNNYMFAAIMLLYFLVKRSHN